MIKIIGAILIILATTWTGFEASRHLSERPRQLRLLKSALQSLEAEIMYGHTPLHTAADTGSTPLASLLLMAGADADVADEDGATAWRMAIVRCYTPVVAMLAAAVRCLDVPPRLLQRSDRDAAALADASDWLRPWAADREAHRPATIAVLQGESRWRRRRPLALIREQRRAVRDAGLVHKEWEKRGSGGALDEGLC